jgi:hypothetical protein
MQINLSPPGVSPPNHLFVEVTQTGFQRYSRAAETKFCCLEINNNSSHLHHLTGKIRAICGSLNCPLLRAIELLWNRQAGKRNDEHLTRIAAICNEKVGSIGKWNEKYKLISDYLLRMREGGIRSNRVLMRVFLKSRENFFASTQNPGLIIIL